jgi:hypothetical protein
MATGMATRIARRTRREWFVDARIAGLVLLCLLATGCATSSVRAVREQGGRPTAWERVQLNVCDGVSWINGAIPFGGGQD